MFAPKRAAGVSKRSNAQLGRTVCAEDFDAVVCDLKQVPHLLPECGFEIRVCLPDRLHLALGPEQGVVHAGRVQVPAGANESVNRKGDRNQRNIWPE